MIKIMIFMLFCLCFMSNPAYSYEETTTEGDIITIEGDSFQIVGTNANHVKQGNEANLKRFERIKEMSELASKRRHDIEIEKSKIEVLGRLQILKTSTNIAIAKSSSLRTVIKEEVKK